MFSDIEGSTRLHRALGPAYAALLADHDQLLTSLINARSGVVVKSLGDGLFAAFSSASDAVAAGVAIQRALEQHEWPVAARVSVRIGLHCADAEPRGSDYVSLGVHHAARVAEAAHGGQLLITQAVVDALGEPPGDTPVRDWGMFRLKDFPEPVQLFGVEASNRAQPQAPRARPATAHNVPLLRTAFVGRDHELGGLRRLLLEQPRVLTVLGPGGVGKTRLVFELVRHTAAEFRDGAWVILLASLRDRDQLGSHLVTTFGLRPEGGQSVWDALADELREKQMLLVLDNCEHLLEIVAELANVILAACPEVSVVATSREPLLVGGERLWRLTPLLDDETGEATPTALALFADRANAATGEILDLADETVWERVAEICEGLDGLPLAIELAAGQLRHRGLDSLHAQLDALLQVTGGDRTGDVRHRTLERTIRWSFDLLPPGTAEAFVDLAVFRSVFNPTDAATVLNRSIEETESILFDLVDKSLLVLDISDHTTYRMLTTIRRFASRQLDSDMARSVRLRDRHAEWATTRAEQIAAGLTTLDSEAHAVAADIHHPDCVAALEYGYLHRRDLLPRLALGLFMYWQVRWLTDEAALWLTRAAEVTADPALRLRLQASAGFYAHARRGDFTSEAVTECFGIREAVLAITPSDDAAHAALTIGELLSEAGEYDAAEECLRYALEHAAPVDQAEAHNGLGYREFCQGNYEDAAGHFERALAAYRSLGQEYPAALVRSNLVEALALLGNYAEAESQLGPLLNNPGSAPRQVLPDVLQTKATLDLQRGDRQSAIETLREALGVANEIRAKRTVEEIAQKLVELEAESTLSRSS